MNHLKNQTSPYLLQHSENPVDWYPWCEEAFIKAEKEDKPVFLSIGYSTCHWCHVMARESFEDREISRILNKYYVPVKVDREERPDLDHVYMLVCQAFTGSGGWPMTIFLTPEKKPFFAGTYFPKHSLYGRIGLKELLLTIHLKWNTERSSLLTSAEDMVSVLNANQENTMYFEKQGTGKTLPELSENLALIDSAVRDYKDIYDEEYGGFGRAPKFPTPHNLLFLMQYYEESGEREVLGMVEKTLLQMYFGGIFDHIGGGFCRYSTDRSFLVPHFEKMLYDNALLILAYSKAYQITKNRIFCSVAEKAASYILREMTRPKGGFYTAQDADSEGVEGNYYLFEPEEIEKVLGKDAGRAFNQRYDITKEGNFGGKNIPNLLQNKNTDHEFEKYLPKLLEYRRSRMPLHLDKKLLTSSNALMIAAMSHLYRVTSKEIYLRAAERAEKFIEQNLCEKDTLYVSFSGGKRGEKGFLNDYATVIFADLCLYEAGMDTAYLKKARRFCDKVISDFYDAEQGGFFLYGKESEALILRPKELYDGAIPSGNSVMAHNLVRLSFITGEQYFERFAEDQLCFMQKNARDHPTGYAMFLMALSTYAFIPDQMTIVTNHEKPSADISTKIPLSTMIRILDHPTKEYPLKNGKTTFYACKDFSCKPPVNEI